MELLDSTLIKFVRGTITPVSFSWSGREYEVANINLTFNRRDGSRTYLCFALDTQGMAVELRLDTTDLRWWIAYDH